MIWMMMSNYLDQGRPEYDYNNVWCHEQELVKEYEWILSDYDKM